MEVHQVVRLSLLLLQLICFPYVSSLEMRATFDSAFVKGLIVLTQKSQHNTTIEGWAKFENTTTDETFSSIMLGRMSVIRLANMDCKEARQGLNKDFITATYITVQGKLADNAFADGEDKVVFKESENVTLFTSDDVTRSLVIVTCPEGTLCDEVDVVFDCAELVPEIFQLSVEIILVLVIAGIIFLLMVIFLPIIYCCCIKRSRQRKNKGDNLEVNMGDEDNIDDPFLMNGKQSRSEISIPYMDASLPPTPKGGRSGFRLEDLLGNNNRNSAGSFSGKPM